ncbi:MAG TPA: TIGR03621 family F420-dependent LLM class oxidoreductase [Acidimicrobiia bacterium]|jgi:probable F420-dependent oxidoreductase
MTRPFRFAVITSKAPDAATWRGRARRAEEIGYSALLMPDHFQDQLAPLTALATAAAVTERLAVGTLVFDNDYRHPVVLAKELATLDLLTGGRVEVGVGAGWKRSDYEDAGIPYDRPGVRIDRMVEAIEVMRALWRSTEPVRYDGAHYRIDGAVGTPPTHTPGGPTLCIGGGGRRMLTIAARIADIVAVNATMTTGGLDASVAATASPQAFDEKLAWVREAAAAAGRSADLELQCHCPFVHVTTSADERDATLAALAPAFACTPADARDIPLTLVGSTDELVETLLRRRDRWGFTYTVVPDDAMDTFGPVVARLAGCT